MMWKYYKRPDGDRGVFAFAADGSQDEFIPSGLVEMSDAEVQAHIAPPLASTADVDAERDRRIDAGVEFQGVMFQSQATDRENIAGAAQLGFMAMMAGAQPGDLRWSNPDEDFVWIASDNSLVPMDASAVVEFGKVAAQRKQALIMAGRQLKDIDPIPSDYIDDKWWS
ncbi:DUF4376 domain-containing protein [Pseudomonas guariconensis]|uniref:DUF4376 domain-containing protein n=1 Tax=Pseudomonas guariconensis TaxID=1288410 RepID=UPI002B05783B|nr:DUF4376 domain-containing protein [Pseudomonas guariconensis]